MSSTLLPNHDPSILTASPFTQSEVEVLSPRKHGPDHSLRWSVEPRARLMHYFGISRSMVAQVYIVKATRSSLLFLFSEKHIQQELDSSPLLVYHTYTHTHAFSPARISNGFHLPTHLYKALVV